MGNFFPLSIKLVDGKSMMVSSICDAETALQGQWPNKSAAPYRDACRLIAAVQRWKLQPGHRFRGVQGRRYRSAPTATAGPLAGRRPTTSNPASLTNLIRVRDQDRGGQPASLGLNIEADTSLPQKWHSAFRRLAEPRTPKSTERAPPGCTISRRGETSAKQFPHCVRPARHSLLKPPCIQDGEFLGIEHDLQTVCPLRLQHSVALSETSIRIRRRDGQQHLGRVSGRSFEIHHLCRSVGATCGQFETPDSVPFQLYDIVPKPVPHCSRSVLGGYLDHRLPTIRAQAAER
jgi:hypothetical protein